MRLINYFICPSISLMLIMSDCDVFLLSRQTNARHICINNILYIVSTPTCFDASSSHHTRVQETPT
jgi:hypothetical protein